MIQFTSTFTCLSVCSYFTFIFVCAAVVMDLLQHFGVSAEVSADEFQGILSGRDHTRDQISHLRATIFLEAMECKLAGERDSLILRRNVCTGKSIREKHIGDVWLLVCSIKNCLPTP